LSMDSFAVSVSGGASLKRFNYLAALRIAFYFGFFQGLMPVIGWLIGGSLQQFIEEIDHWIAFFLLVLIGIKMIYESTKMAEIDRSLKGMKWVILCGLALATSIDALVVGVSFAFLQGSIALMAMIVGMVTFFMSFLGVNIGFRFGHFFEKKAEILGGIILIGLGLKILVEHLYTSAFI